MSQGGPGAWWKVVSLLVVAAASAGALVVFRGCASTADSNPQTPVVSAPSARGWFEVPNFRDPEQEKRYLAALVEGDRRSLELLDRALSEARAVPRSDEAYVAELERERATRTARLEAVETARAKLGP